jgi:hypothetical protein
MATCSATTSGSSSLPLWCDSNQGWASGCSMVGLQCNGLQSDPLWARLPMGTEATADDGERADGGTCPLHRSALFGLDSPSSLNIIRLLPLSGDSNQGQASGCGMATCSATASASSLSLWCDSNGLRVQHDRTAVQRPPTGPPLGTTTPGCRGDSRRR